MSSSPILVRASPAQVRISHERQLLEWGRGLGIDHFRAREEFLLTTGFGKAAQTWVLAPAAEPATLDFFCSCESWRRPVLFSPAGSGTVRRTVGYSIGSVFTPLEHRKKGYAQAMMTLLHDKLALPVGTEVAEVSFERATSTPYEEGNDAVVSFLYSDVGEFYSRCGSTPWLVQGVDKTTTWEVAELPELHGLQMGKPPAPLTAEDYDRIATTDAAQLRASLAKTTCTKPRFLAEPTAGTYAWLEGRAAFAFQVQGAATPATWGFELPAATPAAAAPDVCPSFIMFTIDPARPGHAGELKVVRLHATSAKDGTALLLRTLAQAQAAGVGVVHGWNLDERALRMLGMLGESLSGTTGPRTGSLSAVATYAGLGGEVEWVCNEGYAWC